LNGKPTGIVAKLVKASQSILSYPSNYSQVIDRRKCWVKQSVHNSQQPSPNWKKTRWKARGEILKKYSKLQQPI